MDLLSEDEDEQVYNNIDFLMIQVKLIEKKIKYNNAKIKLSLNKELDQTKIRDTIDIYEILIPQLKEKHIITKIIDLKYEMENIELEEQCKLIYNEYKETCHDYDLDENGENILK